VNYTVSSTDLGKYLKFEVTPVANASPTTGSAVLSAASTQVAEIDYINMILSTGQSLSVGVNSSPARTTTQPYSNLQLSGGNGGLGTGSSFTPLIESGVETISSAMANTITANDPGNDFDVAVGLHGVSGYTYSQLKKGTGPFSTGMTQVTNAKSAATALGRILRVIGVTTIHGETDNFNGVSGPTYQGYLEEWQHDYETDTKAITGQTGTIPLFLDQMSSFMSSYANTPTSEIPIYQLKAAEDNPGKIVMVAPKYFFNYSDRHHLTAASSQWLGEYYGKVMKKVVEDHESWRPLTPDTVTRSGNVIYANFHVPAGNLTFDTTLVSARTNYGFEYADSSSSASISSVQILDGDTVKVTLSTTPTGTNQRLRYAYTGVAGTDTGAQNAGSAAGNLRDTDSYPSLYGNTLYNWAVHFDAPITLDASAPVISAVTTSSVTTSSAVVSWTTDEVADSQIEYGLTGTLTASSSYSATLETSHTRSLTGLLACTTYNFRVRSYDATANLGTSANGTFTTTCTGSAPVVAATTTQITTASGGSSSLTNNGHTVTITVPTGFSAGDAYFQMQQVNASPVTGVASTPSGLSVAGSYLYHLSALSNPTTTLSSFNQPITVTLSYDPAEISGLNESNLVIYRYDGSSWHLLTGCSVNTSAHTVTCTTTAFSYFGIFAAAQSSGYSPAQRDARSGSSQPVATTTPPVATTTTSTPVVAVPVFTRDLTLGSTGEDVRQLQVWLNAHGFAVAQTGAGSQGSESTFFGPATRAALKAFQTSKGISPASGYFGPLTRAALGSSVVVAPTAPTAPVATATFTRNLTVGVMGEDVRQLQMWLNAHGFVVAQSGPGSPGSETTMFGGATRAALKAFQTSKGISPASGYFGPLTRAALQ
jgi:peptidoglycan hydrolase-like protein with peptidoglycan-binding domain